MIEKLNKGGASRATGTAGPRGPVAAAQRLQHLSAVVALWDPAHRLRQGPGWLKPIRAGLRCVTDMVHLLVAASVERCVFLHLQATRSEPTLLRLGDDQRESKEKRNEFLSRLPAPWRQER